MSQMPRSVCLITSGNIASNPRLVKEATALKDAGFSVALVAADIIPSLAQYDDGIARKLGLSVVKVAWQQPLPFMLFRRFRRIFARLLCRYWSGLVSMSALAAAHHALGPALISAASKVKADLYLAHNLAALPAAAAAAEKHNGKLGFDAEDYHCGELAAPPDNELELSIRRRIESKLLPKCSHFTAASPQIAAAYREDYAVTMTPILNVFSLIDSSSEAVDPKSWSGEAPALYWFSQTIGASRGLEQIIDAMSRMQTKAHLALRGNSAGGYVDHLRRYAAAAGGNDLARRISVVPIAAPDQMVKLAATADLGLALEPGHTRNNNLALSNKAFTYLLAGVPVLLSRTTAQAELAGKLGAAALLVDVNDSASTASVVDAYFADRQRQITARAAAWSAGRTRYNWDVEKASFLASVEAALTAAE